MPVGPQSGFDVAFQEFVFYAGPIIQLTYWLVMIVAVLWAVTLFKRWVDHQIGVRADEPAHDAASSGASATPPTAASQKPISVDEFVE